MLHFGRCLGVIVLGLVMTGCSSLVDSMDQSTPTNDSPVPTIPLSSVSITPSAVRSTGTPTATLTPTSPSSGSASTNAADGQEWVVAHTGGEGVYIRREPATGARITAWPDGTTMQSIGSDRTVGGKAWKNVRDPTGELGWVAAAYLQAVQKPGQRAVATPTLVPTLTPDSIGRLTIAQLPVTTPAPSPTPVPPRVTFASVTGAAPGGEASVSIRTRPSAHCQIWYFSSLGVVSHDQHLTPKIADGQGRASWNWTIGVTEYPGQGTATVDCDGTRSSTAIPITGATPTP